MLDRLSYQRRLEKLSSLGCFRGRKGFLGGAPFASHSRMGGGRDLATSTLTSLMRNLCAKIG